MRRFLPELEIAIGVEIEAGTGSLQFAHPGRAFFHQNLYGRGVAQRCSCGERILSVQVGRVTGAQCGGNASLGIRRRRIKKGALGEDRHRSMGRGAPGSMKSCDSTANNKEPRADPVGHSSFNLGHWVLNRTPGRLAGPFSRSFCFQET